MWSYTVANSMENYKNEIHWPDIVSFDTDEREIATVLTFFTHPKKLQSEKIVLVVSSVIAHSLKSIAENITHKQVGLHTESQILRERIIMAQRVDVL